MKTSDLETNEMKTQVKAANDRITHIAHTHISHYDVTCLTTNGQTQDRLSSRMMDNATATLFKGSIGSLKRLAAVFGMSVEHSSESDGCHAIIYDRGSLWVATDGQHILAVDNRIMDRI